MDQSSFSARLIEWYEKNKRDLPWRNTNDIYRIWLSEIILQQTRVLQGLPYYQRFIKRFPNLENLARASEDEVLREWQGLGYYSRARNLHNCAKILQQKHHGKWPKSYSELKKLPGIGDYTAAAIASFAYKEAVPVVDGNVYRVMSRIFGIKQDISSHKAKNTFAEYSLQLLPKEAPDSYNQALMEFGATVCQPQPKCSDCIFSQQCYAYNNDLQRQLPVNLKKVKISKRYFYYIVYSYQNKFYMKQRQHKDVWRQLFDFYMIEKEEGLHYRHLSKEIDINNKQANLALESPSYKHVLTHQHIFARFFVVNLARPLPSLFTKKHQLVLYDEDQIENLPKPKLISNFLSDLSY